MRIVWPSRRRFSTMRKISLRRGAPDQRRLVEQDEPRLGEARPRHLQHLLLATERSAGPAPPRLAQDGERLVEPLISSSSSASAARVGAEPEVLLHGHQGKTFGPAGRTPCRDAGDWREADRDILAVERHAPLRAGKRPKRVLNTVDLPAPFGPMIETTCRTARRGHALQDLELP